MKPTPTNLRDRMAEVIGAVIERVRLGATGTLWQVLGFGNRTREAEVYQGIGISARPPDGSGAALVCYPDGSQTPVVMAVTDPGNGFPVAADETALHNTEAIVYVKSDGTVEVRARNGVAVALALKSDVQEVVTKYNTHTHLDPVSGSTGTPSAVAAPPVGTTVLKGQ